jgi:hypothetical protein
MGGNPPLFRNRLVTKKNLQPLMSKDLLAI